MEDELLDFIDWYNLMYEENKGITSKEIINKYLYYQKNRL